MSNTTASSPAEIVCTNDIRQQQNQNQQNQQTASPSAINNESDQVPTVEPEYLSEQGVSTDRINSPTSQDEKNSDICLLGAPSPAGLPEEHGTSEKVEEDELQLPGSLATDDNETGCPVSCAVSSSISILVEDSENILSVDPSSTSVASNVDQTFNDMGILATEISNDDTHIGAESSPTEYIHCEPPNSAPTTSDSQYDKEVCDPYMNTLHSAENGSFSDLTSESSEVQEGSKSRTHSETSDTSPTTHPIVEANTSSGIPSLTQKVIHLPHKPPSGMLSVKTDQGRSESQKSSPGRTSLRSRSSTGDRELFNDLRKELVKMKRPESSISPSAKVSSNGTPYLSDSSRMDSSASDVTLTMTDSEEAAEEQTRYKCLSAVSSPMFPLKARRMKQNSVDSSTMGSGSLLSFTNAIGPLSIDNSCFDLVASTTENSAVNTPVEKVCPRIGSEFFPALVSPSQETSPTSPTFREEKVESARESLIEENTEGLPETLHPEVCASELDTGTEDENGEEEEMNSVISTESSVIESEVESRKHSTQSEENILEVHQKEAQRKNSELQDWKSSMNTSSSFPGVHRFNNNARSLDVQDMREKAAKMPAIHSKLHNDGQKPSTSTSPPRKMVGRRIGDLRLIEILRVKILQVKGLRGSSSKPIFVLAKIDNKDIHQSHAIFKNATDTVLEEFSQEIVSHFSNLHLVVLEAARPGKTPRPIGRVSLKRKDVVRNCGKDQILPLRVVSKFSDVQGQICLEIKRQGCKFSVRVIDYCDLTIKAPQELYLLVSCEGDKEAKKLKIGQHRSTDDWLDMDCPRHGTLSLKMSLWHDMLRGLNSVFHGQIRVDVDERWTNGPFKWFYLRPRVVDTERRKVSKKEGASLGDMKLWVSYTADHVLPLETYRPLLDLLSKAAGDGPYKASAVAVLDHLAHNDLGAIARPLVQIFAYTHELRNILRTLYLQDIAKCQDLNTLFRSQSLASKMLFELMRLYGHQYLLISLKPVVDKIYADRRGCEIDPSRLAPNESLEKNTDQLLSYFSVCFSRVVESTSRCPHALRTVFADLRQVVGEQTQRVEIERLALSSFLIMRFFAAAILNPKSFGLKRAPPDSKVSRTLVLLSKILQRLANEVVSKQPLSSKEPWLEPILKKVTDDTHRNAMSRFLDKISLHYAADSAEPPESLPIVKDGFLIEMRSRSTRRWKMMQGNKKRFVMLTDNELCWQKSSRGGMLSPKGSVVLSNIDDVVPRDKSFYIKADEKEITFEASSSMEVDEWVTAIEKQRVRALRLDDRTDLTDLYDSDVERELECVHVLFVEQAATLVAWKGALEGTNSIPEGTMQLPSNVENTEMESDVLQALILETIDNILSVTYTIETAHRDSVSKYMNHIRHGSGTRENPIDEENYLLLKRKLNVDQ